MHTFIRILSCSFCFSVCLLANPPDESPPVSEVPNAQAGLLRISQNLTVAVSPRSFSNTAQDLQVIRFHSGVNRTSTSTGEIDVHTSVSDILSSQIDDFFDGNFVNAINRGRILVVETGDARIPMFIFAYLMLFERMNLIDASDHLARISHMNSRLAPAIWGRMIYWQIELHSPAANNEAIEASWEAIAQELRERSIRVERPSAGRSRRTNSPFIRQVSPYWATRLQVTAL